MKTVGERLLIAVLGKEFQMSGAEKQKL